MSFLIIDFELISTIEARLKRMLTSEERFIISYIKCFEGKGGYYGSSQKLARVCGCTDRTVRRYLRLLLDDNVLVNVNGNYFLEIFV